MIEIDRIQDKCLYMPQTDYVVVSLLPNCKELD